MQKRQQQWRRRSTVAVVALALLYGMLLRVPQALAFPYHARIGSTDVYAERPISPRMAVHVAKAQQLLASSPIYVRPVAQRLFLTDGGWRWRMLALQSHGGFALRRPFGPAIIFNRTDTDAGVVRNGRGLGSRRSLAGVIAHEGTHEMLAARYGEVAMMTQPQWKHEGYADHVARESSLTPDEAARLRAAGESHPALAYVEGRQLVAAILDGNGGSVDALFD